MQQSKTLEMWVGAFVALGVVALFFLAMRVSNLSDYQSGDGYLIKARFDNIGSLKVRAPVSMAGVRIGRVSAIGFDKQRYQAVVEMHIDSQYNGLPEDTSAKILTAGLLGEQYIALEAGGTDEMLKDGSEIELTQSSLVLEEVISKFLYSKAEGSDKKDNGSDAKDADGK
jgi:phospholipid/cholesterol/gamma-HCH transport system substrate-binding protein